jgi:hypothetical protein
MNGTHFKKHPSEELMFQYASGNLEDFLLRSWIEEHLKKCEPCLEEYSFMKEKIIPIFFQKPNLADIIQYYYYRTLEKCSKLYVNPLEYFVLPEFISRKTENARAEAEANFEIKKESDDKIAFIFSSAQNRYLTIVYKDEKEDFYFLGKPCLPIKKGKSRVFKDVKLKETYEEIEVIAYFTQKPISIKEPEKIEEYFKKILRKKQDYIIIMQKLRWSEIKE